MAAELPRLLVLTDRTQASRPLADVVRACLDGGARAIVLREKDLPEADRLRLAENLRPAVDATGARLLVASDPHASEDGVHLAAADPAPTGLPVGAWVGRSCHDRPELVAAAAAGCTYATVSPIFTTTSKPGYGPVLGVAVLADAPLPTFALGGIDGPARAAPCVAGGAHGVAVMGALMRADRPDRLTAALLSAAETTR